MSAGWPIAMICWTGSSPRSPVSATSSMCCWCSCRPRSALSKLTRTAYPSRFSEGGQPGGATDTVYYRWHGSPQIYASNYDDAALDRLHMRIGRDLTRGTRAWCIFDNTAAGAALGNALALVDRHDAMLTMTCRSG